MTPTAKRRWFRLAFSLRTLFVVVTVLGCWLGYHLDWIRQRHAMLDRREAIIVEGSTPRLSLQVMKAEWAAQGIIPASPPGLLWIFGEQGVTELRVLIPEVDEERGGSHEFAVLARRLFPESTISFGRSTKYL